MIHLPYLPATPQSFWCTKCDTNVVDSRMPESGKFYVVHGHAWNRKTKTYDGDGDYHGVMFAVCNHCAVDLAGAAA